MRLVSFSSPLGPRLGALEGDRIVDLNAAYGLFLKSRGDPDAVTRAQFELPPDAARFLALGQDAWHRAMLAIEHAYRVEDPYVQLPQTAVHLLPPIPAPPKVLCLGLNYVEHAEEARMERPRHPVLFAKFPGSLLGPGEPIRIPRVSQQLDYEAELAIVIGRRGRYVHRSEAMDYIAGYTLLNDISVRDYQMHTSQWTAGKVFQRLTPVGPVLVTADEVPNPQELDIKLVLNGEVMQHGNTRDMIFPIADIVCYVSEICELEPGDIIATGTPSGVGFTRNPPVFLKPGDVVTVQADEIGELTNPVISESA